MNPIALAERVLELDREHALTDYKSATNARRIRAENARLFAEGAAPSLAKALLDNEERLKVFRGAVNNDDVIDLAFKLQKAQHENEELIETMRAERHVMRLEVARIAALLEKAAEEVPKDETASMRTSANQVMRHMSERLYQAVEAESKDANDKFSALLNKLILIVHMGDELVEGSATALESLKWRTLTEDVPR